MNRILIKIVLIVILVTRYSLLNAQTVENERVGNGIYILPTQLIFPEVLLTYEYFLNNQLSILVSCGYKIPTGKGGTLEAFGHGWIAIYEYQYLFNEYSHGLYFSISPAFYIKSSERFYFSPEFFYRYYWFNNKKLFFDNVETDMYNSIRSENNHVIGLKLLVGFNRKIVISEKKAIAFKIYTGLSARYKIYKYKNVNDIMGDGTIIPFKVEKGTLFCPFAIHLGVKVGLSNLVSKTK